jgi:hypothetical protein
MGTLEQNREDDLTEMKYTKLKKGEHVSVYKGRLMVMKWIDKRIFDKMVPASVQGQDVAKSEIVIIIPGWEVWNPETLT